MFATFNLEQKRLLLCHTHTRSTALSDIKDYKRSVEDPEGFWEVAGNFY